jgi:hypothetical protein
VPYQLEIPVDVSWCAPHPAAPELLSVALFQHHKSEKRVLNKCLIFNRPSPYQTAALSAGLAEQWDRVKEAYAAANRALGNIVKVTPSSKVVGDLANFMVSNNLDEHSLVERAGELSFPKSVVEFLQGYLGQPIGGFPEPLRSRIIKDAKPIDGRPGSSMRPLNMVALKATLQVLVPTPPCSCLYRTGISVVYIVSSSRI